jgi:hypothetical protein
MIEVRLSENEDSSLLAKFQDADFALQNRHRHFSRNFAEFGCRCLLLLSSCFADLRKSVEFGHL